MGKTAKSRRFASISDIIDIKKLEKESRKFLYVGLVIGIFVHVFAGLFVFHKKSEFAKTGEEEFKVITVDFIELPPRMKNPYENWKMASHTINQMNRVNSEGLGRIKYGSKTNTKDRALMGTNM